MKVCFQNQKYCLKWEHIKQYYEMYNYNEIQCQFWSPEYIRLSTRNSGSGLWRVIVKYVEGLRYRERRKKSDGFREKLNLCERIVTSIS